MLSLSFARGVMRLAITVGAGLWAGCDAAATLPSVDPGVTQLSLAEFHPALILPSTEIDLVGRDFVGPDDGKMQVHLTGNFTVADAHTPVDATFESIFVDSKHLRVIADADFFAKLPASVGHFAGQAAVLVDSYIDRSHHVTSPLDVTFDLSNSATPSLQSVSSGTMFVNDTVTLLGDDFLLGTAEGTTHVVLDGCFTPTSQTAKPDCSTGTPVSAVDLPAQPSSPWDRTRAQFIFSPVIGGIHPGHFDGTLKVVNMLAGGPAQGGSVPFAVTLAKPSILGFTPASASLGQYVEISGGGFIGAASDEVTLIHLVGQFVPDRAPTQMVPVDLRLVTSFVQGTHARYVLDETDALGKALVNIGGIRYGAGQFSGQASPILRKGTDEEDGTASDVQLAVAPVRQVVWLNFLPSYVDSLSLYGLQLGDDLIRQHVLLLAERDYEGVNIEFRLDEPTDFALYTEVDIAGPDPNDEGLFGYDNTPGKDTNNERLFDKIGGVNATTQEDGSPGYGGVFAEQFLGFSMHPVAQVEGLPDPSALFDRIFDPIRPDTGRSASANEISSAAMLADGSSCPAASNDRAGQINCGLFVLGNLVGTTLTHELGHSLGLADPDGELFHDPGDQPNRLMDSGDARPFEERAELMSQGPARFCDAEFTYLQAVLPGAVKSAPALDRPTCE